MRWQRPARVLVALLGLGTAVALYTFSRERPVAETPAATVPKDPKAVMQSGAGVDVQYVNDTERYRLEYAAMKTFEGGQLVWEQVHLTFKEDGTEVWADHAEVRGKSNKGEAPAALTLTGHVRLKTGEGAHIEGESAVYDDATGVTNIPGPVTFNRGRIAGTGTGAIYERDTGVFRLLADGRLTTAADDDGAALEATGTTVTFNRATRALLLDGAAKITHGTEIMTADRATLYLSEDEQQFRVIELRANARVMPAPGQTSSAPDMQAQDIDLAFHAGTQTLERAVLQRQARIVLTDTRGRRSVEGNAITLTTATDGSTLTSLDATERVVVRTPGAEGGPERQISAASLVSRGSEGKGLTRAVFEGGVRFVETVPAGRGASARSRTGTAQRLTLDLAGQFDAIEEALFEQNTQFVDGTVTGSADVGTYYASAGRLTLQPGRTPRLLPHVKDESITVDATDRIDVNLDTHSLSARGAGGTVKTVSLAQQGASKNQGSLFSASETMYGFAAEFEYDNVGKRAVYVGAAGKPARIKQGDNEVFGLRIELWDESRDLEATGEVQSIFRLAASGASTNKTPPGLYRITAAHMTYQEAKRTATYTGDIVTLSNPEGQTTAKKMVVTLLAEGRALDRLEATTNVEAVLSNNREALADYLLYEAASGRYTLRGAPLLVKAQDGQGCSRTRALTGYFMEGKAEFPGPPVNPAGSHTTSISCTEALKR